MANDSNRPDVAVFIDFENVYVSVRDKLDANPNFESIMDRCEDFGRVVIARAYADWYRYPRVTSALYANSIEPIYVPTYYYDRDLGRTGRAIKNSVDMNLCIDAMKTLFTNTNIAKFVLATGDRDFIPLVNSIRQQGKEVIIIGVGGAASSHLAQSADEFIFYETLVGKRPAGELHKDQPRAKMPEKGREQPEAEAEAEPEPPREPREKEAPPATPDVYDVLVQAIHLARERGYVCSFGSLKLLMKELMGGEFKENRYKDAAGRPFAKFKDFVGEAERRSKVQVFTSGTVNEVFLPGEDPYKLSQFAQDLKEEPAPPQLEAPPIESHLDPRGAATNGRRRRRRTRGGQRSGTLPAAELDQIEETDEDESLEEDTSADYTSPDSLLIHDLPIDDDDLMDEDRSDEVFDSLLERVEDEQAAHDASLAEPDAAELAIAAEPDAELTGSDMSEQTGPDMSEPSAEVELDAELAEPSAAELDEPVAAPLEATRPFEANEWDVLREIVQRFERAVPFNQIHNALREARNGAGINRTNEELRTLIKQAINSGMLARSGKGNNIVYRLAPPADSADEAALLLSPDAIAESDEQDTAPDQAEMIEAHADTADADQAAPLETTDQPEFYTPEAAAQADLAAAAPETIEPVVAPPTVITAEDSSIAERAPATKQRSRARRKPAEVVEAEALAPAAETPAEVVEAKPKRRRAQQTTPDAASAAEAPAKPKRPRRKKTEGEA